MRGRCDELIPHSVVFPIEIFKVYISHLPTIELKKKKKKKSSYLIKSESKNTNY